MSSIMKQPLLKSYFENYIYDFKFQAFILKAILTDRSNLGDTLIFASSERHKLLNENAFNVIDQMI